MSLPRPGSEWPPKPWDKVWEQIETWDAWWSGDTQRLQSIYLGRNQDPLPDRPGQRRGGVVGYVSRWFWGRPPAVGRTRLHAPLAADIASASSDLLFGDPIRVETGQTALDDVVDQIDPMFVLGDAAEVCAALGSVWLRSVVDRSVSDVPILDVVHPDAAYGRWAYGRLQSATIVNELKRYHGDVWRHFEHHEMIGEGNEARAVVRHALYKGSSHSVGAVVPLTEIESLLPLAEQLTVLPDGTQGVVTDSPVLTVSYVPNRTPHRMWRRDTRLRSLGRADIAGIEQMLDSLDESWSSLLRDIRLAKARAVVPEDWLRTWDAGGGQTFDEDAEYYKALRLKPGQDTSISSNMFVSQPDIRVQAHVDAIQAIMADSIRSSGLSPATLGVIDHADPTATEVNARDRASRRTREAKARLWEPGLRQSMISLLSLNQGAPVDPMSVSVTLAPPPAESLQIRATTAEILHRAVAASAEERVRVVQPSWDDERVAAEVARIAAETDVAMPQPDIGSLT